jgi:hypothetical protein
MTIMADMLDTCAPLRCPRPPLFATRDGIQQGRCQSTTTPESP